MFRNAFCSKSLISVKIVLVFVSLLNKIGRETNWQNHTSLRNVEAIPSTLPRDQPKDSNIKLYFCLFVLMFLISALHWTEEGSLVFIKRY